jgi:hypothetical protein
VPRRVSFSTTPPVDLRAITSPFDRGVEGQAQQRAHAALEA